MQYPWVQEGHKIFRVVIVIQWLLSVVIGLVTGELLPAFILGIPIAIVPLVLSVKQPRSTISQHAIAIGTQLLTALHIHQAFGLIEMHFEIFVVLAFLSYFRNWKVIASGTVVVAVHHLLFFFMQSQGSSLYIFEEGHVTFPILLMHAGFALAEGIVLMYMANQTHKEGEGATALRNTIETMQKEPGRLDLSVSINRNNDVVRPFAELIDQVKDLVTLASALTSDVVTGCEKMKGAAQKMSDISHKTDQEIAMVSAAAEEIAQTMLTSSEQTTNASQQALGADSSAQTTRESISSTSKTIDSLRSTLNSAASTNQALNEQCSNISEAMRAITAVAEQTNLLALNAAIESARAGEHGRGFAVVADEVRTLAIRSKESADQITNITEELVSRTASSVSQMQTCIELVDEAVSSSETATGTMTEIMARIRDASESMTEVASSAVEQQTASTSIAESTSKISEFTAQEVSTAQSLSSEVEVLSEVSQKMRSAIDRFRL